MQEVLESKSAALAQSDRLLAQYHSRMTLSEVEVRMNKCHKQVPKFCYSVFPSDVCEFICYVSFVMFR